MVMQFTINTQAILLMVMSKLIIVEAPILDQDPIGNLEGTDVSLRLRLNFTQARIEFQ